MLKNQSFNLFRVFLISLFLFSYTADGKYGFYHTIDADYFELDECKISHKKPALVDLCILKKSITYLHPNPYFKQSKKAFESSFLYAKQELSESDNRDEHIKTFAKLVAQINDPHTFVDFSQFERSPLPITARLIDNKLYLVNLGLNNEDSELQSLAPFELNTINKKSARKLVQDWAEFIPMANGEPNLHHVAKRLDYFINFFLQPELQEVSIKGNNGLTYQIKLGSVKAEELPSGVSTNNSSINIKVHRGLPIIRVDSFKQVKVETELIRVKNKISQLGQKHNTIIIDLRGNRGGNEEVTKKFSYLLFGVDIFGSNTYVISNLAETRNSLFEQLIAMFKEHGYSNVLDLISEEMSGLSSASRKEYLTQLISEYKNIRVVETVRDGKRLEFLLINNAALDKRTDNQAANFQQIYILVDQYTASASTLFVKLAQSKLNARIVGNALGGNGGLFGSAMPIILPNSKIEVMISTAGLIPPGAKNYEQIVWPSNKDLISLDIPIPVNIEHSNDDALLYDYIINSFHKE